MRTVTVSEFGTALSDFIDDAVQHGTRIQRALALHGLTVVVQATRVRTGRARGNWQVTLGVPASGYKDEARDKTERGTPTVQAGETVIDTARDREPCKIWIHNGVPYIWWLDKGTPKRAGDQMLAKAFASMKQAVGAE